MINLILTPEVKALITQALFKAGHNEIGGIMMGEHVSFNSFKVTQITIQKQGTLSSFVRKFEDALGVLKSFFTLTNQNYSRFNYIGEWHSHPLFIPYPSPKDDATMRDLIRDTSVGANFVVLMIVKLDGNQNFVCTAHTYLPDGTKSKSVVELMSNFG